MILGFSDATLHVVKRGMEAREQGLLCDHLGTKVAPHVTKFHDDGYEMEILEEPKRRGREELEIVMHTLVNFVWNRPCYKDWKFQWLDHLIVWSQKAPWLTEAIKAMYPTEPDHGYSLIHGDPTLANLMMRGTYPVITDPMPRMTYRQEIPNRIEVDVGKLIQSAVGWEYVLGGSDGALFAQEAIVRKRFPTWMRSGYLWAAIHLARVSLRAPKKGRMDVAVWADETSHDMVDSFWRESK